MPPLSHLREQRRFRGNNDALGVLGDRVRVAQVIDTFAHHSRDDLTAAILDCYDGELYGNSMWARKIMAWGNTPERITPHGIFAEKFPSLAQLNLDLGFLSYLPEFLIYAEKTNLKEENPFVVRNTFKEYLGTIKLWRGIRLTEKELEYTRSHGILSSFFRNDNSVCNLEQFESDVLTTFPWKLLENQFYGGHMLSPLLSVSADNEVARGVGNGYAKTAVDGTPKKMYLFELEVPLIDVVPYTEHCLNAPDLLRHVMERERSDLTGKRLHPLWQTNIEQFILYKIDPREIVNVSTLS